MKIQITPDVLTNYFAGRATAIQKQQIDDWVKDQANRELFFAALADYENQQPQYVADVDKAIQRHQASLAQACQPVEPDEPASPFVAHTNQQIRWLAWVAASVVLLMTAGWLFRDDWLYKRYQTAYGQTQQLTLSDGSRVVLNANSRLRVPRFGFGAYSREVLLVGEASFAVAHTKDHQPFLVKTLQAFEVMVLGTEFTVYTRRQTGKVVLNKGSVQLRYREGRQARQLLMKPGDLVTLDQQGHARHRQLPKPEIESAWQQHRFVFTKTSLHDIAQLLADSYGLQLQITDPDLANWTVSGSFSANSADELLDLLMQASSLQYTRQGNNILISKTSTY